MELYRTKIVTACVALMIFVTNSNGFNYIFLKGKGMGGEMMCSDWRRVTNQSERAAVIQWIFGFITGYDTAIRPKPNEGELNGQSIVNLISETCANNPKADLVSVAKYIAVHIQKEINGEVDKPTIFKGRSSSDPDSWFIVKDVSKNSCSVLASRPSSDEIVIITSFKAFTMGKTVKDMVTAECGCERGCDFELPR